MICPGDNGAHVKTCSNELIVLEALFALNPDFDLDDRGKELAVDKERLEGLKGVQRVASSLL